MRAARYKVRGFKEGGRVLPAPDAAIEPETEAPAPEGDALRTALEQRLAAEARARPSAHKLALMKANPHLQQMRIERGAAYRQAMASGAIKNDPTILSWNDVDTALDDMDKTATYSGRSGTGPVQSLNPSTEAVRNEIGDKIANWKQLQASEFWTPEGFDALKKQIGDIRDDTEFGSRRKGRAIRHSGFWAHGRAGRRHGRP